mmetsp:Transcript_8043/g.12967  ORF Transcript_8043/g.12967 Transcript_8043/m.12967 type:complete len:201 (+) Transcript_8043:302-904(+)
MPPPVHLRLGMPLMMRWKVNHLEMLSGGRFVRGVVIDKFLAANPFCCRRFNKAFGCCGFAECWDGSTARKGQSLALFAVIRFVHLGRRHDLINEPASLLHAFPTSCARRSGSLGSWRDLNFRTIGSSQNIMAMTIPALHMSTNGPLYGFPSIISGGAYAGVPQPALNKRPGRNRVASPKSTSFKVRWSCVSIMLTGLISR